MRHGTLDVRREGKDGGDGEYGDGDGPRDHPEQLRIPRHGAYVDGIHTFNTVSRLSSDQSALSPWSWELFFFTLTEIRSEEG